MVKNEFFRIAEKPFSQLFLKNATKKYVFPSLVVRILQIYFRPELRANAHRRAGQFVRRFLSKTCFLPSNFYYFNNPFCLLSEPFSMVDHELFAANFLMRHEENYTF